jgi:hypothetical protein
VDRTAAGGHLDRNEVDLGAHGLGGVLERFAIVIGRMELPDLRKHPPAMRAARVLDRAAGRGGVRAQQALENEKAVGSELLDLARRDAHHRAG